MPSQHIFITYAPAYGYLVSLVIMGIYKLTLDEIFILSAIYFLALGIGIVLTKIYKGEFTLEFDNPEKKGVKIMELKNLDSYEMGAVIQAFKENGYEPEVSIGEWEETEEDGVKELTARFVVKAEEKKEEKEEEAT